MTEVLEGHDNDRLMSARVDEPLAFTRAVHAGRVLEGAVDLHALPRLAEAVIELLGQIRYRIEFGAQAFGGGFMRVQAQAEVMLQCQRTLEPYPQALQVDRYLSPTRNEQDEAALPADWESLPLEEDGRVLPLARLEDELLLALPEFPRKPGSEDALLQLDSRDEDAHGPFAALSGLRSKLQ